MDGVPDVIHEPPSEDLQQEMKHKAFIQLAKKNLCFELEYIQVVIEKLQGKQPTGPFVEEKRIDDDPLMAFSETHSPMSLMKRAIDQMDH